MATPCGAVNAIRGSDIDLNTMLFPETGAGVEKASRQTYKLMMNP